VAFGQLGRIDAADGARAKHVDVFDHETSSIAEVVAVKQFPSGRRWKLS